VYAQMKFYHSTRYDRLLFPRQVTTKNMDPVPELKDTWPSLLKVTRHSTPSDFREEHIPKAIDHIMERVHKCTTVPTTWEIVFVGSGFVFLPEILLLNILKQKRIRVVSAYFVDSAYFWPNHADHARTKIQASLNLIRHTIPFHVSCTFPPGGEWAGNGRMVLTFSRLVDWASGYSNIARFLTDNWRHVQQRCRDSHVAFLDFFYHIDRYDNGFKWSEFSDLTQPPLKREVYRIGSWTELWTEYVKGMTRDPDKRAVVLPMQPNESYDVYCAKYDVETPNDARDHALDLCKLCGRSQISKKRRIELA
jgi:hypothetical protein